MNWDELIICRVIDELCLVGILHKVDAKGNAVTKERLLESLLIKIDAEREMIKKEGRKNAAKVYGAICGCSSSMESVNLVMNCDFKEHYSKLIKRNQLESQEG